ncbi:hypothetical protein HZS61_004700 [Fusarium oxysporum f. sp. conglutinans]|uniref:CHK kinase-like domain-containing protein n=1 Tax=Fusarium oxysporum f. sp. conglutinans TaxID=100902 RepID=A0A8H6LDA6_FUSOX|nr:hypothetical protein HZS61_004700 [Fusarium oxysporum f. sp. conglutinans]
MFENDTDDSASNVCVKGGFNPDNRESLPFLYAIYRLEAEFYYYLAPRLKIPLPPVSDAVVGLLTPEEWDQWFAPGARPPVPKFMEDRERMTAAFKALWASDSKMKCIVHGDAHIGNTFISPTGEPGFLDWQVNHAASALHDVAYFIGGSMLIQDRRAHEKDLLQSYLSALKHMGGPKLGIENVWEDSRR